MTETLGTARRLPPLGYGVPDLRSINMSEVSSDSWLNIQAFIELCARPSFAEAANVVVEIEPRHPHGN